MTTEGMDLLHKLDWACKWWKLDKNLMGWYTLEVAGDWGILTIKTFSGSLEHLISTTLDTVSLYAEVKKAETE